MKTFKRVGRLSPLMGETIAEKILSRKSKDTSVVPGEHITCEVDYAMAHDHGTIAIMEKMDEMGVEVVWDPERIICPMDHDAPSHDIPDANEKVKIRDFVNSQEIKYFYDVGTGIAHNVMVEKGIVGPGDLVVGSDSHTTSVGVLGAAGTGLGYTEMAYVFATGKTWFRVPETTKVKIEGNLSPEVGSKDIMLHIAGEYGTDIAQYRSVEYCGDTVHAMDIDDRFTMTNMTIELGGKFGLTPPDEKVLNYLDDVNGGNQRKISDDDLESLQPDGDATYNEEIGIDATTIGPKVSKPHSVGNVVDVEEVEGEKLDQVFIGSCTNGKYSDLKEAGEIMEDNQVSDETRMIITPASRDIYSRAEREGLINIFNEAGAIVTNSTCGACNALGLGLIGGGETCLAAQNRNYKGRMGSNESFVYLSSPKTAAASAINGEITDPRKV
jgi:3-isopropylmalate/(R)-2-methylmalate dehydratase large subunit